MWFVTIGLSFVFFTTGALSFLEIHPPNDMTFTSSTLTLAKSTRDTLTLTCTFKPTCHIDFRSLGTLTLSKRSFGDYDFRVVVTANEDQVVAADNFDGAASGYVTRGCHYSELTVIWDNPTEDDRGEYRCEAKILHASQVDMRLKKSLEIGPNPVDAVVNCMQGKPKASLTAVQKSLVDCGAPQNDWFKTLRDVTEREFSNRSEYHTVFSVTRVFNSNSFYFVLTGEEKFDRAVSLCKKNNGYLAEINTEQEFLFLAEALSRPSRIKEFNFVILGAHFDRDRDDFVFYTHPEAPMYLGHWAHGEPHKYQTDYDWLFLAVEQVSDIRMSDGKKESLDVGYLCEISRHIIPML